VPELDPAMIPRLDELVTEDETPVDSIYTEKQQRLLTEPLYSFPNLLGEGRPFLALANVGWFHTYGQPPLVPDCLLSLDVTPAGDLRDKAGRSYFQWLIGKPPDVAIEIVSDRRGGEEDFKMRLCARQRVVFYVIYDPNNLLKGGVLRAYVWQRGQYEPVDPHWFPEVGLGLTLWTGTFEGQPETWLRWCDRDGQVIPTGAERAEEEHRRAEEERRRADQADDKVQRLAAQLRALGVEPEA
jgi:hypothetical protein